MRARGRDRERERKSESARENKYGVARTCISFAKALFSPTSFALLRLGILLSPPPALTAHNPSCSNNPSRISIRFETVRVRSAPVDAVKGREVPAAVRSPCVRVCVYDARPHNDLTSVHSLSRSPSLPLSRAVVEGNAERKAKKEREGRGESRKEGGSDATAAS